MTKTQRELRLKKTTKERFPRKFKKLIKQLVKNKNY